MQSSRIVSPTNVLVSLFIVTGCATMARRGGGDLPTCFNAQSCGPSAHRDSLEFGPADTLRAPRGTDCNDPAPASFVGPVVVSDFSDGFSSDGRGPYARGADGVLGGSVNIAAGLSLGDSGGVVSPRKLLVNLSHPVPKGGGVPLGTVTVGADNLPRWTGLHTQWRTVSNTSQNLHDIPVGQMVTALQMNVWLFIDRRFHLLQMGPQPFGSVILNTWLSTIA